MIISPGFIGIDVSKDHLDIFDGISRQIANSAEAIAAYLGGLSAPQLVLLEATGHYDRELRRQMQAAGMRFARVNPARARAFAHATGRLAKTDAIDAQLLAAMAQALNPAPHEPADQERQDLADLHRRRAQMVAARQQERTRLPTASALIAPSIVSHIDWLDQKIEALDISISELIDRSAVLKPAGRLLRSIPGIGPVAATALLALMPELGHRTGKAIAALAGLAPMNRDSGQYRGQRTIAGGRAEVRRALYMAAVTAIRSDTALAAGFRNLTARGKPPKLALIAVARKIAVIANAIIKTNQPFKP